jgi:transcriptional regulator with PAS, ATPase and Fis domain
VVVYGETGTGKELVAKAVHTLSPRGSGEFVPVNCGAIPEELFESEFFGYRKGAFTGANQDRAGFLDRAKGGSLFLDEIAEMRPSHQAKLLRALGSGEYTAVGGRASQQADVRIIAATNRDLESMVREGSFRKDLFYRIHVLPILLPPLRERKEDIPFLVEDILDKLGAPGRISSRDLTQLLERDWPGNVRELQNVLERFVAFGHLDFLAVEDEASAGNAKSAGQAGLNPGQNLRDSLASYEKQIITQTLRRHNGNRSHTAASLGLPRKTLFRKMKALGID